MKWVPAGNRAWTREDGRYTIARAPEPGYGEPGQPVTFWLTEGKAHVKTLRDVPDDIASLRAAFAELAGLCDA